VALLIAIDFPEALEPFPERRLRPRNMPEVTGVRQGGKL